jgi:hypothetical protein
MAEQINMPLARLNVMVGVSKLDGVRKSDPDLIPLVAAARALVAAPSSTVASLRGAQPLGAVS